MPTTAFCRFTIMRFAVIDPVAAAVEGRMEVVRSYAGAHKGNLLRISSLFPVENAMIFSCSKAINTSMMLS